MEAPINKLQGLPHPQCSHHFIQTLMLALQAAAAAAAMAEVVPYLQLLREAVILDRRWGLALRELLTAGDHMDMEDTMAAMETAGTIRVIAAVTVPAE